MKYLHLLVAIVLFLPSFAQTSYILAGDSLNTRYTDYIPDAQSILTFQKNWDYPIGGTFSGSMMIDLDGDGIRDVIFTHIYHYGDHTFKLNQVYGLNGTLISYNNFFQFYSTDYKIANKFNYRDTIDINTINWDDTVALFIHSGGSPSGGNFPPSDTPGFVGIMIPKDNDTLFAWVQFQNRGCCLTVGDGGQASPIITDFACGGTPGNHVLLGYTSVADAIEATQILIYPNPFSNDLYVKLNSPGIKSVQYSICNLLGQVIYNKSGKPNAIEKIDVANIPKGIYLLNAVIDGELIEKKIVRQ